MEETTDNTAVDSNRPSALSPFQYPVFRSIWIANGVSGLGSVIQSVGAAWLMLTIAQSADMVALVQGAVTLPIMLLSLVAGAIADNLDRRIVMLWAQSFMLVVSLVLAVCAWSGLVTPWLLLLLTFLISCGGAFNAPAWQASVGDMVPRAEVPGAISLNGLGFNIARSVGPAIGGAVVAIAGAGTAFALNAASYVALIAVLARWRPPKSPQLLPPETLGIAMVAGVRYVAMSPSILTVMVRSALFGFGAVAIIALLPVVAKVLVSGGAFTYGSLLGAFGVGAVIGALSTTTLRSMFSTETLIRGSAIMLAIAAMVAGRSEQLPLTMVAMLLAGAGWVLGLTTFNVAVQMSAPRWVVARALSIYQMAAFGGMAAGSWLWGMFAEITGTGMALIFVAVVMLGVAVCGAWWRLKLAPFEMMDLDPLGHWSEPDTAVAVQPRAGPVVIEIEYVIHESDILEFLRTMGERRRIRRRDGARHWSLMRDLADPRVWFERYETSTWLDYVRHNHRLTQHDGPVREKLRKLHRGAAPPRVRRMLERQTSALPQGLPASRVIGQPLTDPTQSS